jgi:predicted PurR-regulated permease PerM
VTQSPSALPPTDPHPVPWAVRATASWAWRLLLLAALVWLALQLVVKLALVVIPFVAALLITAALSPLTAGLRSRGVNRGLATGLTIVGFLAVIGGAFTLVGNQVADGLPALSDRSVEGINEIRVWLIDLGVPRAQLDDLGARIAEIAAQNREQLTSGAISTATLALETVAGVLLALFSLIFLLYDGDGVWRWVVGLVPRSARSRVDVAGHRAWVTLTGYVRGTVLVALVDAIFIYIVLLVLRVELALPLAVIVFFGAFVPLVGATLSATLAALVALVTQGPVIALLVIAGIILVQQIEGHVLQPFLLGRFVRLHPLAVVLAIAAGAILAGIPGALVAVPLAAVLNTVGRYLAGVDEAEDAAPEQTELSAELPPSAAETPAAAQAAQAGHEGRTPVEVARDRSAGRDDGRAPQGPEEM